MSAKDESKTELLRSLPPVLRARGFRLYLEGGQRVIDLWLNGGKAVLGHKPPNVVKELKNSCERGLFAPFPHVYEARLLKVLGKLFPKRRFRLYSSKDSLSHTLEKQGFSLEDFTDPAFPSPQSPVPIPCSLWRPFLGKGVSSPLLLPVLPFPLAPWVLVLDESLEERFPPGELIPPVILAPTLRALYDMLAEETARSKLNYPKIEKALLLPNCKWRKQGIYLTCDPDAHENRRSLWKHFLENGFLLPPDEKEPLILPGELSPGEEAKLALLLGSAG